MTNTEESLTHIGDAINNTTSAISVYDSLTERVAAAQETVQALESDVSTLRANSGGLDARARASKFSAANSALSLAQSDLALAADALSLKKAEAVRTGKVAASKLFEARDSLRIARQSIVAAQLSKDFDWTGVPVITPTALAANHRTVRAVAVLGISNLFFELQHSDDFSLNALRRLNEHWAELKPLIEAESVELNISAVVVSRRLQNYLSRSSATNSEHCRRRRRSQPNRQINPKLTLKFHGRTFA